MFINQKIYKSKPNWIISVPDYSTVFKDSTKNLWYLGLGYDNVKKLE
jgi:hypothetical protein